MLREEQSFRCSLGVLRLRAGIVGLVVCGEGIGDGGSFVLGKGA